MEPAAILPRTLTGPAVPSRARATPALFALALGALACSRGEPAPTLPSRSSVAQPDAPGARRPAEPVVLPPGERRTIELEGGVRVEVLAEGQGEPIAPGDEVALHYVISYVPKPPAPPAAAVAQDPVPEPKDHPDAAAVPGGPVLITGGPIGASSDPATPAPDAPPVAAAEQAATGVTPPEPGAETGADAPAPVAPQLEPIVVASTRDFGAPVRVRAGRDGPLLPALSQALLGLRAGTRARITLPAERAYGSAGLASAGIPADVALEAEVEIREVRR